jgi:HEAT repeat protein
MSFDPWHSQANGPHTDAEVQPADEDVIRTLAEIEKASSGNPSPTQNIPIEPGTAGPKFFRNVPPAIFFAAALSVGAAVIALNFAGKHLVVSSGRSQRGRNRVVTRSAIDSSLQAEAEQLLHKLAIGDNGAANEILEKSATWTGKTERTSVATQWITVALNLHDLHAREAAIQAELALDGVNQDETGLKFLEQAVANPSQRAWALWELGALGNRGVDPVHTAKIIGDYLSDPAVNVRASAVDGLALVATDETIPMMLDRFRNDPSPLVQERAACALAESGMYTHEQRMTAATSLVSWLDDPSLNTQQRAWVFQALGDISGQNFGTDSAAWRNWYESTRS